MNSLGSQFDAIGNNGFMICFSYKIGLRTREKKCHFRFSMPKDKITVFLFFPFFPCSVDALCPLRRFFWHIGKGFLVSPPLEMTKSFKRKKDSISCQRHLLKPLSWFIYYLNLLDESQTSLNQCGYITRTAFTFDKRPGKAVIENLHSC